MSFDDIGKTNMIEQYPFKGIQKTSFKETLIYL